MKKLIFVLLILSIMLVGGEAYANQEITKIIDVTLDADPLNVTYVAGIGHYRKVAFVVIYDETETGGVSARVSIMLHPTYTAGSNVGSGYFFDFAGSATLQTEETLTSDGEYIFWLPESLTMPYVTIYVDGLGTDSDDTIDLEVYMIGWN